MCTFGGPKVIQWEGVIQEDLRNAHRGLGGFGMLTKVLRDP